MIFWKKVAISVAATSMIVSPMAASAALAVDGTRATTVTGDRNELEGSSWLPILLGLAIVAGGIWLVVDDNNDDEPVSP